MPRLPCPGDSWRARGSAGACWRDALGQKGKHSAPAMLSFRLRAWKIAARSHMPQRRRSRGETRRKQVRKRSMRRWDREGQFALSNLAAGNLSNRFGAGNAYHQLRRGQRPTRSVPEASPASCEPNSEECRADRDRSSGRAYRPGGMDLSRKVDEDAPMPKTRSARLAFAVIACFALIVIGRNLYRRCLDSRLCGCCRGKAMFTAVSLSFWRMGPILTRGSQMRREEAGSAGA